MTRWVALGIALALALGACNEGNSEMMMPDLAVHADLSVPRDLAMPDLAGPTCGSIVLCIFKCGVTDLQCDQTCVAGAQPKAIQEAGALALCAAQNCLGGDAGAGLGSGPAGMLGILNCLEQSCGNEVNSCDGLPFVSTN